MTELVTIGVYGWDAETFFAALQAAGVDLLCDIRARRGVRGSAYAFANSARLQRRLAELGIAYVHRRDVAPGDALRGRQAAVDKASHTAKRQRTIISTDFATGYRQACLEQLDPAAFMAEVGQGRQVVALLCVEREPAACHRGLLADHLAAGLGLKVRHLLP